MDTPDWLREICPIRPDTCWVGDFTYLWFHGRYVYLATVKDAVTREIMAWQLGLYHTSRLIIDVLEEAQHKRECPPQFFHSDQGSEYTSHACVNWLVQRKIIPSNSPKGKPWFNGQQESSYSTCKLECGKPGRHATLETLIEAIGRYVHYYNTRRIHTALRMAPQKFSESRSTRWVMRGKKLG